jgi:cyclic pyranopterin phosphate synthase
MKEMTHVDKDGKARMVDVGDKAVQARIATARGFIRLTPETLKIISNNKLKKGDVLTVAQIAGINAAKETAALIPLCHNIVLDSIKIDLVPEENRIKAVSEIKCTGKTGAEMEALTSVAVALLTIYDMCKAVDKSMVIEKIELIEKKKL